MVQLRRGGPPLTPVQPIGGCTGVLVQKRRCTGMYWSPPEPQAGVEMTAPTLPAYRTPDGSLKVRCDYCRRWHQHGGCNGDCTPRRRSGRPIFQGEPCHCPPGTGNGHRAAHCWEETSPYRDSGYYLKEVN